MSLMMMMMMMMMLITSNIRCCIATKPAVQYCNHAVHSTFRYHHHHHKLSTFITTTSRRRRTTTTRAVIISTKNRKQTSLWTTTSRNLGQNNIIVNNTTSNRNNDNNNDHDDDDITVDFMQQQSTQSQHPKSIVNNTNNVQPSSSSSSLLVSEGLFAVYKPLNWTSNDVVSYLRGILERDIRNRQQQQQSEEKEVGENNNNNQKKKKKRQQRIIKVGHGGTLDPLATGVLVIGVGNGTKELQTYLSGSKGYVARGTFGYETTTLDMDGNITKTASYEHITYELLNTIIQNKFIGTNIQQIPPIYSAIKKNGTALYKEARKGKTIDDIVIEPRIVEIYNITLLNYNLPEFELYIECGGGTYIRSLIRDIGYELNTVATTTYLERTKQGQFVLNDALVKENWSASNIYTAINKCNQHRNATTITTTFSSLT